MQLYNCWAVVRMDKLIWTIKTQIAQATKQALQECHETAQNVLLEPQPKSWWTNLLRCWFGKNSKAERYGLQRPWDGRLPSPIESAGTPLAGLVHRHLFSKSHMLLFSVFDQIEHLSTVQEIQNTVTDAEVIVQSFERRAKLNQKNIQNQLG